MAADIVYACNRGGFYAAAGAFDETGHEAVEQPLQVSLNLSLSGAVG